jgi:hypothetical protein
VTAGSIIIAVVGAFMSRHLTASPAAGASGIISIPLRPEPWAEFRHCFANVARKVRQAGGSVQLGWLWGLDPADEGLLLAAHHAVWKSPTGDLLDITPAPPGFMVDGSVRFEPDDQALPAKYPGCIVGVPLPNRYYAGKPGKRLKSLAQQKSVEAWAAYRTELWIAGAQP